MNAVPLARHLVPAERQPTQPPQQQQQLTQVMLQQHSLGPAAAAAGFGGVRASASAESVAAQHVDAPMYLGDGALYDLRPVAAKERLELLDREERNRCVNGCPMQDHLGRNVGRNGRNSDLEKK